MKKNSMKNWLTLSFLIVIFGFGSGYLRNAKTVWNILWDKRTGIDSKIQEIDKIYEEGIPKRECFIALYGAVQKGLGRRAIEEFTLIKTDYGKIQQLQERQHKEDISAFADNIKCIYDFTREKGIPIFYITSVLPVVDKTDLPVGVTEYSHENAEALQKELENRGIPLIDLRSSERIQDIEKESLFYKTDHHWSIQTCFAAYVEIIEELNRTLGWELDSSGKLTDLNNYDSYIKEDSFLGSYGVKVGEYYAGKDDFLVYYPRFETNLTFQSYENHTLSLEKTGDFMQALLNRELIEDKDYYNKYRAFSNGGYVENRVINHLSENNRKVLLISHSYGRPLTQYLSLCFEETRNLDPQKGQYTENYLEYIEEYEPDLVLIFTEFEGEGIEIEVS